MKAPQASVSPYVKLDTNISWNRSSGGDGRIKGANADELLWQKLRHCPNIEDENSKKLSGVTNFQIGPYYNISKAEKQI